MPSSISSTYTTSSYGAAYSTSTSQSRSSAALGLSETTPDGDTVEISSTAPPSGGGSTPAGTPTGATYPPRSVGDRFKFDIANGMLNRGLRFDPLTTRFNGKATATYSTRQSLEYQVTQTAGQGSAYTAMFELQYRDSQPNPSKPGTHLEAMNELNRMTDRNFNLLNIL